MSNGNIKAPAASNNSLALVVIYINTKSQVKLDLSYIKQVKLTFTHKQVVNIYIVYEINLWPFVFGKKFALGNSLFRAVKLNKNADSDKYMGFFHYQVEVGLVKMC